jgi:hypothetical protein
MYLFRLRYPSARSLLSCALALFVIVMFQGAAEAARAARFTQYTFGTPEAAVEAMVKAFRNNNEAELYTDLYTLFGSGSGTMISSGDKVADRESRAKFIKLYDEKNRMEITGDRKAILHVGNNDWPFPIPLVKIGNNWSFDTKRGKEEILSRRIGENELGAIQTCLAIADAQREYAAVDRDGNGLLEYAQKFTSTNGKMDGLYWEVKQGENLSPLGPLVAKARNEGYKKGEKPVPYRGYFFRILTSQGKDSHGGAYSYLVKDKMVGGFALVAYPASYGVSGVKTFIVNHEGVVYEKDLGTKTAKQAQSMSAFNPDKSWGKAE